MRLNLLLVATLVVIGIGCGEDEPKKPSRGAAKQDQKAADAPKTGESPAEAKAPAAEGAIEPLKWRDKPKLDHIPEGPVVGMGNDQEFRVKSVLIQPGFQGWTVAFHDKELPRPTGIISGSHHLDLHINVAQGEPAVGKTYSQELTYGGGYWQVEKTPKPPKEGEEPKGGLPEGPTTTSWNAKNAYVLELTKWEVKPWDPEGPVFQDAGRASGRVIVMY